MSIREINNKAVFKLEGNQPFIIVLLAILCGGWATIIAGFLQTDSSVKKNAILLGAI